MKKSKKNKAATKDVVAKTVTVKIIRDGYGNCKIAENGTQVEMLDKDENYVKKIFTEFKKAQEILEKYYLQAQG